MKYLTMNKGIIILCIALIVGCGAQEEKKSSMSVDGGVESTTEMTDEESSASSEETAPEGGVLGDEEDNSSMMGGQFIAPVGGMGGAFMGMIQETGSFGQGESGIHRFTIEEEAALLIEAVDPNDSSCFENDLTLTLFQGQGPGRMEIQFDDDGGEGYCPQMTLTLAPGAYEAEVGSFSGSGVPEYVFRVYEQTLLAEGDPCLRFDFSAGICGEGLVCGNIAENGEMGVCTDPTPVLSGAELFRYRDQVLVKVTGQDADQDAYQVVMDLLDANDRVVSVNMDFPSLYISIRTSDVNFDVVERVTASREVLDQAVAANLYIEDFNGNISDTLRVELVDIPRIEADNECRFDLGTGACEVGTRCFANLAPQRFPFDIAAGQNVDLPFTIEIASIYRLETMDPDGGACPGDTTLRLYRGTPDDEDELEYNDDGGEGLCSLMEIELEPGNYTARAAAFSPNRTISGVLLEIEEVAEIGTCVSGQAPVVNEATLQATRGERLVISAVIDDPEEDVVALRVGFVDSMGNSMQIGGEDTIDASIIETRTEDGVRRQFAVLDDVERFADVAFVEVQAIDDTELVSAVEALAEVVAIPELPLGDVCDPSELENICASELCYPRGDSATCLEELPGLNEGCSTLGGCSDGFDCYQGVNAEISFIKDVCLPTCATNSMAPEDLCDMGSTCIPDFNFEDFSSPGVCILDQNCVTGQEDTTCPAGDYTCARGGDRSLCVDLSLIVAPRVVEVQAGEKCDNDSIYCAEGMTCEAGKCRTACTTRDECSENELCFDFASFGISDTPLNLCLASCDVLQQDCPDMKRCEPLPYLSNGQPVGECVDGESGTDVIGATCEVSTDQRTDSCQENSFCLEVEPERLVCKGYCTATRLELCGEQEICLGEEDTLGMCFGECDPFAGTGCESGQTCEYAGVGPAANSTEGVAGRCATNNNIGSVANGEACDIDYDTDTSNCAPGHLCLSLDFFSPTSCMKLCRSGSDGEACPAGFTCDTELLGGDTVGLCVSN